MRAEATSSRRGTARTPSRVTAGEVVASAGDPQLVTHFRSSAKPLQALPVVRARPDLDDAEIAIACASHLARPEQLDAVRSLLAKAPATEDDLECGPEPTPASSTTARASTRGCSRSAAREGWPTEGYRLPDHPCQRALPRRDRGRGRGRRADVDADRRRRLRRSSRSRSRSSGWRTRSPGFDELDGGPRVVAAMRAHPELIRGPGAADTVLMQTQPGWIAKGGAEGLLCAAVPDGLGIALKVEDGATRAVRSALAAFLARLGVETGRAGEVPVRNSRGEVVGELRAV